MPSTTAQDAQDARWSRRPPGLVFSLVVLLMGLGLVRVSAPLIQNMLEGLAALALSGGIALLLLVRVAIGVSGFVESRHARVQRVPGALWRWVVPGVVGAGSLAVAHTGLARAWLWRFNEPILRAEAERMLGDARTSQDSSHRRLGTIGVTNTAVDRGRVHFRTDMSKGWADTTRLTYVPPGAIPDAMRFGDSVDLGGGWTLVLRE